MVLIVQAILKMYKACEQNWIHYLILLSAFVCVAFLDLPVIPILLVSAVCGILYQTTSQNMEGGNKMIFWQLFLLFFKSVYLPLAVVMP